MSKKLCYSPAGAAQQLGICKNHIYKYLDSKELRSFKLGQRRLINHEALDEFRLKLEKEQMGVSYEVNNKAGSDANSFQTENKILQTKA